jgi:hypothetical protein
MWSWSKRTRDVLVAIIGQAPSGSAEIGSEHQASEYKKYK